MSNTIIVAGQEIEVFDFQGNSYAFIPFKDAITWQAAKSQAEGIVFEGVNGHLATVTSKQENGFIVSEIVPISRNHLNGSAWLGATDQEIEGQWEWITGETWSYTNWANGQPDHPDKDFLAYFPDTWFGADNEYVIWYSNQVYGLIVEFEGTGSPDDNLIGTEANDTLSGGEGNDNIVGRLGNDLLKGGTGDDELIGDEGNDKLNGDEGDDILSGGAGNDKLNGGIGKDVMIGGEGNDTYYIDNINDIVVETGTSTKDKVFSSLTYTLGNNVEQLILTGSEAIDGIGNSLNNSITGNAANNILKGEAGKDKLNGSGGNDLLVGGEGNDILTGGKGKDSFVFNSLNEGVDTIKDFSKADDLIQVSAAGFGGGLSKGNPISSGQFVFGTTANDSSDRFIYDPDTGKLYFDQDGVGGSNQVLFAIFNNQPFVTSSSIEVI
jgi:RTX calcium-binding nonapeptide repeat (4 copies)/Lectin C-type domain